ncbi:MAG: Uma2 family endonuclease [Bryobacteraceae bacterium]|nr:Uma2 family endonuclease [Bryobacteraceae bacterium]
MITVEEFLKLPDPKEGRLELHHGETVVVPPAKWGHRRTQERPVGRLQPLCPNAVVMADLAFRPSAEYELWVAGVALVSAARADAVPDDDYLAGAPDQEMNDRRAVCLAAGCQSFWLVDPKTRTVSVSEGNLTRHYSAGESISCPLLAAPLAVDEIFG